jgi:hypothetical protein
MLAPSIFSSSISLVLGYEFFVDKLFGRNNPAWRATKSRTLVAGHPAMMRYNKDADGGLAYRNGDLSQVVEQPDFPGDVFASGQVLPPSDKKSLSGSTKSRPVRSFG